MDDLTPNIPLLRKALKWAEAEAAKPPAESQWDQSAWMRTPLGKAVAHELFDFAYWDVDGHPEEYVDHPAVVNCQTSYCIAGWVCAMNGDTFDTTWQGASRVLVGRQVQLVADRATDLLGITDDEADALFAGENTIAEVRAVAEEIAARAGVTL